MNPRSHVGTWILVAAVLAAIVAGALILTSIRSSRDSLADRFESRGELAASFTGEYLRQLGERQERLATREFQSIPTPAAFSEIVADHEFVAGVLLDEDGTLLRVHPHDPALVGRDLAARYDHLERALDGEVAVSNVVPSATRGEPIIAVAVRFDAAEGPRVFSSGFRMAHTPLDSFIRNSIPIGGSAVYVLDGAGTVVASSESAAVSGRPIRDAMPGLDDLGRESTGEIELAGRSTRYISTPIEGTTWRLVATVPVTTLYGPLRSATLLQVALLFTLGLLAGAVGLLVLRLLRAERRLQAKVLELEAANRTLDAFSHTLVHDLRNPLATIGGFAHTLGTVLSDADEQVREMTGHIESSAQRMAGLIEDVLTLATVARGLERTDCSPTALVREAALDVTGVELELGWLPERISANRPSMFRCFQNLLENASHYAAGPDGAARVTIHADETPWHWRFFVEDDGPGVSEQDQRKIFQAFERGSSEHPGGGTGLGLSIVAACAQAHGGSVGVENRPEGGARFTVEIGKPSITPEPEAVPRETSA